MKICKPKKTTVNGNENPRIAILTDVLLPQGGEANKATQFLSKEFGKLARKSSKDAQAKIDSDGKKAVLSAKKRAGDLYRG